MQLPAPRWRYWLGLAMFAFVSLFLFLAQRKTNPAMRVFCAAEFSVLLLCLLHFVRRKTLKSANRFQAAWLIALSLTNLAHFTFFPR